jgi:hypothetical protein
MLSQHSRGVALITGGMLAIGQGALAEPDQGLRTGLKDLTKNTRWQAFLCLRRREWQSLDRRCGEGHNHWFGESEWPSPSLG